MIPPPICILYTQDSDLVRRIKAFARAISQVRHVDDPNRLEAVLQQIGPALLIIDLRARESRELLDQVQKEWPQIVITALGILRSEPLRDAEQSGIYAAEDLQLDRRRFQALITRAFDYLRVLEENRDLREESAFVPTSRSGPRAEITSEGYSSPSLPMLRFPRVFRPFESVEALLTNLVEGVADAAGVTRVGIFSRNRPGDQYHLRAGLRCLPETHQLEFAERDSLVRWFERHAHLVSRSNLAETPDRIQRSVLRRALDSFGAEVIVPLYGRGRILGWLFFGHRLTGQRFEQRDLEGLMILAENVSTVLENALLYEEVTLQKTLAETLLKTIPPGIVAIDENGTVRWFNPTAEQIADIALLAAAEVKRFGVTPRVALLSHSSFGSSAVPEAHKMREARTIIRERSPDLVLEGEMRGDAALSQSVLDHEFPDSDFEGPANVLVMPNLDAANISYNLLRMAAGQGLTVGGILLGAARPAHILTPSSTVRRIVNMAAVAAADAVSERA